MSCIRWPAPTLSSLLLGTLTLGLSLGLSAGCTGGGADESGESGEGAGSSEDESGGDESEGGETTGDFGDCGNGVLDLDEICDDGNNLTEYPPYAAADCIDNCSMLLASCGDGVVDPGEDCDDGNADSRDLCTSSCTVNTQGVHAACTVFQDGEEVDPLFNISEGEIQNCDAVAPAQGMAVGCNRSWEYIGNNLVYAAGGDCQMITLKCEGGNLCPPGPIGDYDAAASCPDGHQLITKTLEGDGAIVPTILSKVCLKTCTSDRECRWNEADSYWQGPGEYRCAVTPESMGTRVCSDGRNNAL